MVLRLKTRKSRSLPGLRKTEHALGLDPWGKPFITKSYKKPPSRNAWRFFVCPAPHAARCVVTQKRPPDLFVGFAAVPHPADQKWQRVLCLSCMMTCQMAIQSAWFENRIVIFTRFSDQQCINRCLRNVTEPKQCGNLPMAQSGCWTSR